MGCVAVVPDSLVAVPDGIVAVPRGVDAVPRGVDAVPGGVDAVPGCVDAVPGGVDAVPGGEDALPGGICICCTWWCRCCTWWYRCWRGTSCRSPACYRYCCSLPHWPQVAGNSDTWQQQKLNYNNIQAVPFPPPPSSSKLVNKLFKIKLNPPTCDLFQRKTPTPKNAVPTSCWW